MGTWKQGAQQSARPAAMLSGPSSSRKVGASTSFAGTSSGWGAQSRMPALLPWHACLLAFSAGCLAWETPWAGAPAWGLLLLFCRHLLQGWARLGCFAAALALGAFMAWAAAPNAEQPEWLPKRQPFELTARILERESLPGDRLRCILSQVHLTDSHNRTRPLPGRLAWTWDYPSADCLPQLTPGANMAATMPVGPVEGFTNFGSESSEGWWLRQGVVARSYTRGDDVQVDVTGPGWWWERLRASLLDRTATLLAEANPEQTPDAKAIRRQLLEHQGRALALAMSFGERQWLSHETVERVRRASLAHAIALSGSNVGFVALLGWVLAWGLGWVWPGAYLRLPRRKWGVVFGLVLVTGFVWLGGSSPSLLRAALMYGVWCVLTWRGRPAAVLDGLFLAVGLLLLASPTMALDLRLQLSVAAVAGIACYVGLLGWRIQGWGTGEPIPGMHPGLRAAGVALLQFLGVTMAAQLALLPLQLWHFSEVQSSVWCNLVGLPALNLLVAPFALCGVVLTAAGQAVPVALPVARGALEVASLAGEALLACLEWLDGQGLLHSHAAVRPHWALWIGWWGVLCWGVLHWGGPPQGRRDPWRLAALGASCLLLVAGLLPTVTGGRGTVRLTALDVGQGQALVLEGPDGRRALIDGGGFHSRTFDPGRSIVLPVLAWLRRPSLELVFISHHDVDHLRGCYYPIAQLGPRRVLSNGGAPDSDWDRDQLARSLAAARVKEEPLSAGEVLHLGDPALGLRVTALTPARKASGASNAESLTLRVDWQGQPLAVIPGDMERPGLERLVERLQHRAREGELRATALVLPHHGAASSLCEPFLDAVRPAVAIASAGRWNQWGFPSPVVRKALAERAIPMLVTSEAGAVQLEWDSPSTSVPNVTSARGN